jgi:Zn-dependent M28 family amino/carboxypeptidase
MEFLVILKPTRLVTLCAAAGVLASGCATPPPAPVVPGFSTDQLAAEIKTLASDEFEGRRPATAGEEKTVAFIENAYRAAGLKPGVGNGYRQPVPFVELTTRASDTLRVDGPGGKSLDLEYGDQTVFWTKRVVPQVNLEASEIVFVGYGIVEPAMGWNDYAGVDMKGKTALILINDPGFETNDATLFKGRAMTYHGRWTYKFEEAARQGASAAIIVHEEAPAAYPWAVVQNGAARPQLVIDSAQAEPRVAVEGWVTREAAEALLAAAGLDYATLKAKALKRGFEPVPLGLTATGSVRNGVRRATSSNVVGVLPGSTRPDEYVVLTAHWDHLGRALAFSGDAIFNGAVDNATGTAGLLELARAFGEVSPVPERSVLFVAFTGEEYGLLGSEYFAEHPTVPLDRVAAGINIDGMSVSGRTNDVVVVGYGSSELEKDLEAAAAKQGRVLVQEPTPEKGYYYRSDHFNLAKKGVPMIYAKSGVDSVAHGKEWGLAQQADYVSNRYHKPSDEFDPNWDLSGAVQDLEMYFAMSYAWSQESAFRNWYPGNEFRAIRDRSLAAK